MLDADLKHVAIIGDGQMGLAMADAFCACPASVKVTLWSAFPSDAESLASTRKSPRLDTFTLPDRVRVISGNDELLGEADLVISAVPCQHTRTVWRRIGGLIPEQSPIVSVTKGVEVESLQSPVEIIADALAEPVGAPIRAIGALSGPTIARELVAHLPAAMVVASTNPTVAEGVQQALDPCSWIRIYTSTDLVGVELAGAVKNVIAIAAGAVDGLGAGFNAKSALLARGLAEIVRLGAAMGARQETFFGVAGVGDLATTCFSPTGRNRSCGEALGRGVSLDEHLASIPYVVEGVETTKAICALADKHDVEMPITRAVHAVLFEGVRPVEAIERLMQRPARAEQVG